MQSLENLVSYPWIHSRLKEGTLSLTGWYFDFDTGDLSAYNTDTCQFEELAAVPVQTPKRSTFKGPQEDAIPEIHVEEKTLAEQLDSINA